MIIKIEENMDKMNEKIDIFNTELEFTKRNQKNFRTIEKVILAVAGLGILLL